uniref:Uncharacterized protein n=1 Tax=Mustela putorius furo TaxID=9669 RepID=M3XX13_MUSPF
MMQRSLPGPASSSPACTSSRVASILIPLSVTTVSIFPAAAASRGRLRASELGSTFCVYSPPGLPPLWVKAKPSLRLPRPYRTYLGPSLPTPPTSLPLAHCAPPTGAPSRFLQHSRSSPAPGPLHWLFLLLECSSARYTRAWLASSENPSLFPRIDCVQG